jgi:hypothetical protein
VLLAACSLTTSLDGISSGAPTPLATPEGGGVDAGGSPEASAALDGSTGLDAAGGIDAGPPGPFCASIVPKPTFCDDFERTSLIGAWENRSLSGGGSVTLAPSTRTPTGQELITKIPVFPAGSVSVASLDRNFVSAQRVTLSYALRIEAAPGQGSQQVMLVAVTPPGASGDFFHTYLFVTSAGVMLVEETFPGGSNAGGSFVPNTLSVPIVFGTWQRIDMTLTLVAPARLVLAVDGKTAFDGAAVPFYRPGVVAVGAGIHYTDTPSGPLALHVDDLYLDLK